MSSKEIMSEEDFNRIFNARLAEKCCANCKHGELCGERNGILNANASLADDNDRLRREVAELEREVAELRECLKETMADAVAEYKNNSCFRNVKCGEIERCDTCKVMKWRKVLKGASND